MTDQPSTQEGSDNLTMKPSTEPFDYINDVLLTAEELSEEWSEVAHEARMKLRAMYDALVKIEALKPLDVRPSGGRDHHECHYIAEEALHPKEPHD